MNIKYITNCVVHCIRSLIRDIRDIKEIKKLELNVRKPRIDLHVMLRAVKVLMGTHLSISPRPKTRFCGL